MRTSALMLAVAVMLGAIAGCSTSSSTVGYQVKPQTAPPMDPSRTVVEKNCAQPIDTPTANLQCK